MLIESDAQRRKETDMEGREGERREGGAEERGEQDKGRDGKGIMRSHFSPVCLTTVNRCSSSN